MSGRKDKLKFLSQSVLLEEAGLPRINIITTVLFFIAVALFIKWSTVMKLDEVVNAKGGIIPVGSQSAEYIFTANMPAKDVSSVGSGMHASVNIPGITKKDPIRGVVEDIEKDPMTGVNGSVYYRVKIKPDVQSVRFMPPKEQLPEGMEINVEIITGSRTLFEYFIGPIMDAKKNSFREK